MTDTELIIAGTLQKSIKNQTRSLAKMRASIDDYNKRQEKAKRAQLEPIKTQAPTNATKIDYCAETEKKERFILDWAKAHYQHYQDIRHFPSDLAKEQGMNIALGNVYLCLKKHSYIKQHETTEYRVMDAYFRQNGRLTDIAEETGLKVWIVAKTIERLGFPPKWQEYRSSRYVIGSTNKGIEAERLFKQFVPDALDCNEEIREGNPSFDFVVNDKTIDVKEFAPLERRGRKHWLFRPHTEYEKMPDFYCLFLAKNKNLRLNGDYHCLLIPKDVLPIGQQQHNISFNPENETHKFFFQFEVEPMTLSIMLSDE